MKTLYIECTMGAAGDMLTAALLDLLSEEQRAEFLHTMEHLIPGVAMTAHPAEKCGIHGLQMQVTVKGQEEESQDVHPGEDQQAAHVHSHDHEHGHEHHHHDHEHPHEHAHEHEHEHGHEHGHEHAHGHHHHHATMAWVEDTINGLELPVEVKRKALMVYESIAQAESAAHGCPVSQIHFHEVGALDAVADVTAVCLLMHLLAPEQVVVSPVHLGSGQVRCAHGVLPVPAPATAYLMRGLPCYTGSIRGELCTPTGAALLKTFADRFGPMPVMTTQAVGIGVGKKDFEAANILRVFLGESGEAQGAGQASVNGEVAELCCNLDDMTGEAVAYVSELLLEAGALDVYTVPIQMKKGRPAVMLCCLCRPDRQPQLTRIMLEHTTSWGVRSHRMQRCTLATRILPVKTKYGKVWVKQGRGFGVEKCKAEYADAAQAAKKAGVPLCKVQRAACKALKKR